MISNGIQLPMETIKTVQDKYERATRSQIIKTQSVNFYFDLFNEIIPNNYSLVSVNNRISQEDYVARQSDSLRKLNVANYNLYRFCEIQYRMAQWDDQHLLKDVEAALGKWENLIKAGNSFLCFNFASFVIHSFSQINYPIIKVLHEEKYRVISETFMNIKDWVKSFFKLNIYISHENLYERLGGLMEYFHTHAELFSYIEKLEIAKEYFPVDSKGNASSFPAISLFFDHHEVVTRGHPALQKVTKGVKKALALTECLEDLDSGPVSAPYAELLGFNMTLSQGYQSYKKYLALIQVLDEVYDVKCNYAYLKA
jgi:hypothetical protein